MQKSVIIIGAGLGGLFTGALLARNGLKVTVVEKNHIAGGGLQTFRRYGHTFETGMHIVGGFQPGGTLHRICRYLGILDQLDLIKMPEDCLAEVICALDGTHYYIPQGRAAFTDYLISLFPQQEQGIRRYVDSIYQIAGEIDLFNLRSSSSPEVLERYDIPVDTYLKQFTSDSRLLCLLAFLKMLYGGSGNTPAYIHALIHVLYLNGTYMFGQSSQQLADVLMQIIRSHEGEVITGREVEDIRIENRSVAYIGLKGGERLTADLYVSSLHINQLMRLCGDEAFSRATKSRIQTIHNSCSAFKVYYEIKPGAFPLLDSPVFINGDTERVWISLHQEDMWPKEMALFMTSQQQNAAGHHMLMAMCTMPFETVEEWHESKLGARPEAYLRWKEDQMARVTSFIEAQYLGFAQSVVSCFASSPLSFRDWLGAPEGSIFGLRKEAGSLLTSQLPVRSKVDNLFLTGQCINLHGICGVPLTAIQTAEAILGQNSILDAIHQSEKEL